MVFFFDKLGFCVFGCRYVLDVVDIEVVVIIDGEGCFFI